MSRQTNRNLRNILFACLGLRLWFLFYFLLISSLSIHPHVLNSIIACSHWQKVNFSEFRFVSCNMDQLNSKSIYVKNFFIGIFFQSVLSLLPYKAITVIYSISKRNSISLCQRNEMLFQKEFLVFFFLSFLLKRITSNIVDGRRNLKNFQLTFVKDVCVYTV